MAATRTRAPKARKPGYREPWQGGARAYPEADSLRHLAEAAKRKRKPFDVLVRGIGAEPCASCGIALQDPYHVNPGEARTVQDDGARGYRVVYYPRSRRWVARHYYCSWGALMADVVALGRML